MNNSTHCTLPQHVCITSTRKLQLNIKYVQIMMNPDSIKNVLVLGTGNMGPGIALLFARENYTVTMWGPTERDMTDGVNNFNSNVEDMVQARFHGQFTSRIKKTP